MPDTALKHIICEPVTNMTRTTNSPTLDGLRGAFCKATSAGWEPGLSDETARLHFNSEAHALVCMTRTPARNVAEVWPTMHAAELDSVDVDSSASDALLVSAKADLARLAGIDPSDYPSREGRDITPACPSA